MKKRSCFLLAFYCLLFAAVFLGAFAGLMSAAGLLP